MKKYTKTITIPMKEDVLNRILKICEKKDMPVSVFVRDSIKLILEKEESEIGK